jgi:hypothetical protein
MLQHLAELDKPTIFQVGLDSELLNLYFFLKSKTKSIPLYKQCIKGKILF